MGGETTHHQRTEFRIEFRAGGWQEPTRGQRSKQRGELNVQVRVVVHLVLLVELHLLDLSDKEKEDKFDEYQAHMDVIGEEEEAEMAVIDGERNLCKENFEWGIFRLPLEKQCKQAFEDVLHCPGEDGKGDSQSASLSVSIPHCEDSVPAKESATLTAKAKRTVRL